MADKREKQEGSSAGRVREEALAEGEVMHRGSRSEQELAALTGELTALDEDIAVARAASHPQAGLDWHRHREPPGAATYGERVVLRDATEIVIRAIEAGDAPELERGLEHLSAMSRYRRFRAPVEHYSPAELEWLTRVDHRRHEALVALDPHSGTIVGVARYVCDPHDQAAAHVTYVVADRWQHRGVGVALVERLAARATAAGVERLTARMLVGDDPARRLLARIADELGEQRDGGIVEITARLRA